MHIEMELLTGYMLLPIGLVTLSYLCRLCSILNTSLDLLGMLSCVYVVIILDSKTQIGLLHLGKGHLLWKNRSGAEK